MRRKESAVNIANIITLIRIFLVPLFVIFLIKKEFLYGLIVFSVAGISDGLDGFIARCFNQKTILGAYLDPIADKLLIMSAFVCLAILEIIPEWLAVIVLARDIVILIGIVIFSITNIHIEIKPSIVSKCTTCIQLFAVIWALLSLKCPSIFILNSVVWSTAALTITSGLHYVIIGLKILQELPANNNPVAKNREI